MEVKIRSPDEDANFFNIVAGVLQGDTLTPYLFIICLDYIFRMSIDLMKENGFIQEKARSRQHSVQTITDADCADDIEPLANIPIQVESLLHSLKQTSGGIDFHGNADKMECFN